MKVNVYSLSGKKTTDALELPKVFEESVRPDLIKKAVLASQTARYQPQGRDPFAGKRTSAEGWGTGRGASRISRVKGSGYSAGGHGAFAPQAVGGRNAHPPMVEKQIKKKINAKERKLATASAIAATAVKELVIERGHIIDKVPQIPLITTDELEALKTAKEVEKALSNLGISADLERAKEKKVRSGKGTMRGRRYKKKKSVLLVIAKDDGISKGAKNIPGIDIVKAEQLGVEQLAPGTHCGRLTVYTKSAIDKIAKRFE
ncbi:50S ribosomal protein L4 [archaeon]|nr:50S ribosomal protein L4 [archaeon]